MKKCSILVLTFVIIFPILLTGQKKYKIDESRAVIIYEGDTTIKCKVLIESVEIKLKKDLIYHWFYTEGIKINQGGYSGSLLHGNYKEFDKNDNLIYEGNFEYGLKNGEWKKWDSNGNLILVQNYKNGLQRGKEIKYDSSEIVRVTKYKNDLKHGIEKLYESKNEISKKKYRKGILISKDSFIKRLFSRNSNREKKKQKENE